MYRRPRAYWSARAQRTEKVEQLRKYERGLIGGVYPSTEMSVKGFLDKYFSVPEAGNPTPTRTVEPPRARPSVQESFFPQPREGTLEPSLSIPLLVKPTQPSTTTEGPKRKTFHIFTDGACSDNGRRGARGGFGVYVYSLADRSWDRSLPLLNDEPQTNNRGELKAIQCALDIIQSLMPKLKDEYDVYWIWSDSEYSINCLTKWADGWRRHGWRKRDGNLIQNIDLIKPMVEQLLRMPRVTLHHVRSHQDAKKHEFPWDGNAKADELARKSIVLNILPSQNH